MLSQMDKGSLQRASREWRDVVRTPSLWRELCLRYYEGSTQKLLAHLKGPRFA